MWTNCVNKKKASIHLSTQCKGWLMQQIHNYEWAWHKRYNGLCSGYMKQKQHMALYSEYAIVCLGHNFQTYVWPAYGKHVLGIDGTPIKQNWCDNHVFIFVVLSLCWHICNALNTAHIIIVCKAHATNIGAACCKQKWWTPPSYHHHWWFHSIRYIGVFFFIVQ